MIAELMTAEAAAASIGVSVDCIYRLMRTGKLAHYRLGPRGGTIRIRPSDLEAYVASGRVEMGARSCRPAATKHVRAR